ncbi:MAG: beta-ketoacyl synthase N-terminal-like domain-containing protein [Caldilineaceae bacterium]
MRNFLCFTTTPAAGPHVDLAGATMQADGIGILDAEFCDPAALPRAVEHLAHLRTIAGHMDEARPRFGVKLTARHHAEMQPLRNTLDGAPHWLILTRWRAADLEAWSVPPGQTLLLEITDVAQLDDVPAALPVGGFVAKGNEAGGHVGEDSAFVLAQKVLARTHAPVYVQGGIGVYSAAACRAGGAAGVILDDQCWLMPESPLEPAWQRELAKVNGQETAVFGTRLGQRVRVLLRPTLAGAHALRDAEQQLETDDDDDPAALAARWHTLTDAHIGWHDPAAYAWPAGQAIGRARELYERYRTTGRLIQAMRDESYMYLVLAQELQPLAPGAPLAASHGTRYPIIQGPMTRVSDTADFAKAVADAGALPMLALSMMQYDQVMPLLEETQARLGAQPWGVGILGFVSPDVRSAQMRAVFAAKPRFAIIAGGRPDQVAEAEAQGIATYVHVPVPTLLPMYLAQGIRRFIFEGRECGGHIGPLTSFALWDSMVSTLLAHVQEDDAPAVHVVFAGGIHDERSAAMVAALAAPLAAAGMKVGVLMGTAYLFTQEAVRAGAIVEAFQQEALGCRRTIDLEISPGHAIRCVDTPFTREFYAKRRQLLRAQTAPREVREQLESLTLGRLRIASKGIQRNAGGDHVTVKADEQVARGMYMIGQVATLRQEVIPMHELHDRVSAGGAALLTEVQTRAVQRRAAAGSTTTSAATTRAADPSHDVAIIGISLIMPGAQETEAYWRNIADKVSSIVEIPPTRWDRRLHFSEDPQETDRIASKWGGFIDDVPFDPMRFGIPPRALNSISLLQLIMLETVRRGLVDAGYAGQDYDHEHTAVIVGTDGSNPLTDLYGLRTTLLRFRDELDPALFALLPPITEESMPGTLSNVVSGRGPIASTSAEPTSPWTRRAPSSLTAPFWGARNCPPTIAT